MLLCKIIKSTFQDRTLAEVMRLEVLKPPTLFNRHPHPRTISQQVKDMIEETMPPTRERIKLQPMNSDKYV